MLYTNGHRLRLYTDDPYVEDEKETLVDEVLPAKWPDVTGRFISLPVVDDESP